MRQHYSYGDEEPAPRGRWFSFEGKPFPRRTDRAFRVAAVVLGFMTGVGAAGAIVVSVGKPITAQALVPLSLLSLAAGGLAYGFTRAIGMVAVGLTSMAIDGPEWTVRSRAMFHDLRLRSVWALLLEMALFLAAAGMVAYSAIDAVRSQSVYSACVFVLLACMSFWPLIRHRIRHRRWPG
jgi:hypothetical protein